MHNDRKRKFEHFDVEEETVEAVLNARIVALQQKVDKLRKINHELKTKVYMLEDKKEKTPLEEKNLNIFSSVTSFVREIYKFHHFEAVKPIVRLFFLSMIRTSYIHASDLAEIIGISKSSLLISQSFDLSKQINQIDETLLLNLITPTKKLSRSGRIPDDIRDRIPKFWTQESIPSPNARDIIRLKRNIQVVEEHSIHYVYESKLSLHLKLDCK